MNEQPIHDPEARELVAKIEAGTAGEWEHSKPPYLQHILGLGGRIVCHVEDRNQGENSQAICAAHNYAPAILKRLDARVKALAAELEASVPRAAVEGLRAVAWEACVGELNPIDVHEAVVKLLAPQDAPKEVKS